MQLLVIYISTRAENLRNLNKYKTKCSNSFVHKKICESVIILKNEIFLFNRF